MALSVRRQVCTSSAVCKKNLAAAGPESLTAEFVQKQIEEFHVGKRHLANMMGEDPENFTQEDIDVSSFCKNLGFIYLAIALSRLCPTCGCVIV